MPYAITPLRRRGNINIWLTQDAIDKWRPGKTGARGRPQEYSDHTIQTAMLVRRELTTPEVGDPSAIGDLLAQITSPFDTFIGAGTYDSETVSQAVLAHQPDVKVVIPPHKTAVPSLTGDTQRDQHSKVIAEKGRITWQRESGYNLRSDVELAMQRYKRIFSNTMKARALPQQKTEAWISASALNMMTNLGMPISVKV